MRCYYLKMHYINTTQLDSVKKSVGFEVDQTPFSPYLMKKEKRVMRL